MCIRDSRGSVSATSDSKSAKDALRLLHRKPNNIGVRSFDAIEDFSPKALSRVSARFVERIYFCQIIRDSALIKFTEMHLRDLLKAVGLAAACMANKNSGPNLVDATAQPPQYFG